MNTLNTHCINVIICNISVKLTDKENCSRGKDVFNTGLQSIGCDDCDTYPLLIS